MAAIEDNGGTMQNSNQWCAFQEQLRTMLTQRQCETLLLRKSGFQMQVQLYCRSIYIIHLALCLGQ